MKSMSEQVVEPEVVVPAPPAAPEEKTFWEEKGYVSELARVCGNLEALEETSYLPADLLHVIHVTKTNTKVEDFHEFSEDDINNYINMLRNDLPQYYNEIVAAIRDIGRARPIVVDDDFI
jgi:hypothetical protein